MTATPTPAAMKNRAMTAREIERLRGEGFIEGRDKTREEVIDFLQKKYMDPSVARDTPEARAILELAREIGALLRPSAFKKPARKH